MDPSSDEVVPVYSPVTEERIAEFLLVSEADAYRAVR